jgi:hypothetical protein
MFFNTFKSYRIQFEKSINISHLNCSKEIINDSKIPIIKVFIKQMNRWMIKWNI